MKQPLENGRFQARQSVYDSSSALEEHDVDAVSCPTQAAVTRVRPRLGQPRTLFDVEDLDGLRRSIAEHGILEPLIVRPMGTLYEIVCGERRYRAAKDAGLTHVPVLVRELNDDEAFLVSLHENLQRATLTPIEEARAYRHLIDCGNVKNQAGVARLLGLTEARVSQKLALLEMPIEVQERVTARGQSESDGLTERHVRALRRLSSAEEQAAVARIVCDRRLSVGDTEALVRKMLNARHRPAAAFASKWISVGEARYRPARRGFEIRVTSGRREHVIQALRDVIAALEKAEG